MDCPETMQLNNYSVVSTEAEYSLTHCTVGLNTPRSLQQGGKAIKLQTASLGEVISKTAGRRVQQITSSRGCTNAAIFSIVQNT